MDFLVISACFTLPFQNFFVEAFYLAFQKYRKQKDSVAQYENSL